MSADPFNDVLGLGSPPAAGQDGPPAADLVPVAAGGAVASIYGGGYDAADRFDRQHNGWAPVLQHPDDDILPDKDIVDARARDMVRNDAYIQGGAALHKDNIVGAHFMLNTRPATRVLFGKDDEAWEEAFQAEVEELFDLCAESPNNWLDAQRTNTLTSMVRLAVGTHLAGGEVLAVGEWLRDQRPFATAVQMIDTDRLSDPMDRMISPTDRENIRGGIRFDGRGAPQSYFIRSGHPSDAFFSTLGLPQWKEVQIRKPWGRQQVIHIHEQTRPDQSRGISELAASLRAQKSSHRFRDVNLQRAIMQSLYAAAITSELPRDEIVKAMGGSSAGEGVEKFTASYLSQVKRWINGSGRGFDLDGARIPIFYPGTDLKMLSPSSGQALGMEFEQSLLRYIAASIGVSYEQLSRDYTSTNYSSARAAMTETWKFMQARKKLVADRFASAVFRLWLEEQIAKNRLSTFPASKAWMLYEGGALNLKFDAISRCDWVGASRGQIDEYKETQAAVMRIEAGLSTAEDELARLGRDWRKVYRQLKREQTLRETLKLVFVSSKAGAGASANTNKPDDGDEREAA